MKKRLKQYLPIRKVVVAAVGGALTWAAMRCGLTLGSAAANQAATALVALAFAYAERDPRVVAVLETVEKAAAAGESGGTG